MTQVSTEMSLFNPRIRRTETSDCSIKIFLPGFWVMSVPRGGIAYWFPSRQENLTLSHLPATPTSKVIIRSTRLTRFPPRTPKYNLALNLCCGKDSNERVITPLYTHLASQ